MFVREDKINVLLVDDRHENLVALEALLSSNALNLVKCESGEAALKFLMKEECALILLDVQMPGIDGYETAKLIKSRERNKQTPIIFITAINQDPEHVFTGYSVGAIDYIFKPFDPDILKSKVDTFIEMYFTGKKLADQAKLLNEKMKELEQANARLLRLATELQRAEALAKVIGDTSIDTMVVFDDDGAVITANPAVTGMFGYAPETLIGRSIDRLFAEPFVGTLPVPDGERVRERDAIAADGRTFPAEVQVHRTSVGDRLIYACTIRDITERKEQLKKLEYMALHDELTCLPNRAQLLQTMETMRERSYAFIVIDLNNFKAINDTLGHTYGDKLLKRLGDKVITYLREGDLVARLGGDEFAVVLPNRNATSAADFVKQLLRMIEEPVLVDGVSLAVGASMGIVVCPEHGRDPETLLMRADVAMYAAKREGTGYAIYAPDGDRNDPYHLTLMADIRSAVVKGQFELFYQPKMSMSAGRLAGFETLIRWNHPEFGRVMPGDFIPIAESIGFIHSLTCWVLEEAVRQCKAWETKGYDICVSVNLSVRSLQNAEFPSFVSSLLRSYALAGEKLCLEVTESFLMSDAERAIQVLHQIKRSGVMISIDDFGTGFSSMSYLNRLPVSEVKIDKSFVMNMEGERDDSVIVRSIIQLAHNLRKTVVAEGVEREQIWNMLEQWGCDEAQGYYIARPMCAADAETFMAAERVGRE